MDMILLDWTRMGKSYCLAGVGQADGPDTGKNARATEPVGRAFLPGQSRVVRPLLARNRDAPVRNVGWSPYQLDGHTRWEVFELVGLQTAEPQPPHLEDVWVQTLRPRRTLAGPALRRAILQATLTPADQPWFGTSLTLTRSAAYLPPGTGARSLTSLLVPVRQIAFTGSWREGTPGPDYRVSLALPGLEGRSLPVKDHFLLQRAELASASVDGQIKAMTLAVRQMGEQVLVRLGLSRSFQATPARTESACWLMADGFFSFNDPQC